MTQHVVVHHQYAPPPRRRTGSLGCLGVFSVFCLMCFTVGELGAAWWLDASWFDRFAFWRAPLVHAEPTTVAAAEAKVIMAKWAAEATPGDEARARREGELTKPVTLDEARVAADYDPAKGVAVSDSGNGASVRVPAGAIRQRAKVSLTQVQGLPPAMITDFAGPVYEVKVDDRDHYQFNRPIELSIPFAKGLVANDKVVLAVWEDGKWTPLPSKVDLAASVVTGTSPHASVFTVANALQLGRKLLPAAGRVTGVLGLIAAAAENDTTRAAAYVAYYGRSEDYETPEGNFKIHYYSKGPAAVPRDWEVLNDPLVPKTDLAPLYVRRIGHWLEYGRAELEKEGFALPPAKLIRYDCFVLPLGDTGGELGESPLAGPLFVSARIKTIAEADQTDSEDLMNATCVHELLHVAQGEHYSWMRSKFLGGLAPLCEADAEYNSWRFWNKRSSGDEYHVAKYIRSAPDLLNTPFDKATDPTYYSYSLWFEWMQRRFGEETAMKFVRTAHSGSDGKLTSMDAAAKHVLGSHGIGTLGEALSEFAIDYYHRDFWTPTVAPKVLTGQSIPTAMTRYFDDNFGYQKGAKGTFMTVARKTGNGSVVRNTFDEVKRGQLLHLTAPAVYVTTDEMVQDKNQPQPKLVIEAEGPAAAGADVHITLATGQMRDPYATVPAQGSPGDVKRLPIASSKGPWVVDNFGAKGGPNVATIIIANHSLTSDLGGLTLRRWLLEPPAYAQLEPQTQGSNKWTLKWPPAPLDEHRQVFDKYRVYRRRQGAPRGSKELVKEVASVAANAEFVQTELTGADVADYVYSIATVDLHGNESDTRDADLTDPFIGTWDGEVTLVEGSFVTPTMAAIKKASDEADAKNQTRINAIIDPGQRQREQQSWQDTQQIRDKIVPVVNEVLGNVEQAARVGVPMQFQVRMVDGKYMCHLSELVWGVVPLDPAMQVEFELARAGKLALRLPDTPPGVDPIKLALHRFDPEGKKPNVIREDSYVLETKGEAAQALPIRCVIRWNFERSSKEASAPPAPGSPQSP